MTTQSTTAPPAATAMFPSTELANWQHLITAKPIATTPKNAQSAMTATSWNPKDANAQKTAAAPQLAMPQITRCKVVRPTRKPATTARRQAQLRRFIKSTPAKPATLSVPTKNHVTPFRPAPAPRRTIR